MSCEDQGYGLISDGCVRCPGRPALIRVKEYGMPWWRCPNCNGSYGEAA